MLRIYQYSSQLYAALQRMLAPIGATRCIVAVTLRPENDKPSRLYSRLVAGRFINIHLDQIDFTIN